MEATGSPLNAAEVADQGAGHRHMRHLRLARDEDLLDGRAQVRHGGHAGAPHLLLGLTAGGRQPCRGMHDDTGVHQVVDHAIGERNWGPILGTRRGTRMDRHAATRRLQTLADQAGVRLPRMHPHMLRHTFVTTMLDAGVDLRGVQIAARHADPRTSMRYDRARKNLDRHPNCILAAYMASGT
jgi:integrase